MPGVMRPYLTIYHCKRKYMPHVRCKMTVCKTTSYKWKYKKWKEN